MPNHITNKLIINGERAYIDQILGDLINNEFTFGNTVPEPSDLNVDYDWYNWHIEHWGTKWDAYEANIISNDLDTAELEFLTAWSPPDKWLDTTSHQFPTVEFTLYWVDEDFPSSGLIKAYNGLNTNESYGYSVQAENFVEKYFPDIYELHMDNIDQIDLIINMLNDDIHIYFQNVNISHIYDEDPTYLEIVQMFENNQPIQPEQSTPDIAYLLVKTNDGSNDPNIYKKIKKILKDYKYQYQIINNTIRLIY